MPRWTAEARERQRRLIKEWQPWESSTGPRTEQGKEISSQNARRVSISDTELIGGLRKIRHELGAIARIQHRQRIDEAWDAVIASFNK
ncbi:hypothetical protein H6F90_00230 [Trichocoleus sp. FACHB-591]|uniref:hypothetical protein n=1 Tax=Trichocoleus sp. FACHB-591 TaxID=2692872 RepID=UPI0016896A15|nr:hypothetical protein [Trichocoleus sp. FACHB-591]MBD2093581.1 hypothetical protein [Trichocoleus sp. FACHB-591]